MAQRSTSQLHLIDPKLASEIKKAIEFTGKSEDEVKFAFHECDNDLHRAIEYLLSENLDSQWYAPKEKAVRTKSQRQSLDLLSEYSSDENSPLSDELPALISPSSSQKAYGDFRPDDSGGNSSDEFEPQPHSSRDSDRNSTSRNIYERKFSTSSSEQSSMEDDYDENFSTYSNNTSGMSSSDSVVSLLSQEGSQEELSLSNGSLVPVNLFQEKCSLKIDCLPLEHRHVFQDLTHKIGYHINYFSLDTNSKPKLKLICQLCRITLDIEKTENHVQNQQHLEKLARKSKVAAPNSITNSDLEFLGAKNPPKAISAILNKYVRDVDKQVFLNLAQKLKDSINDFKPSYKGTNKLYLQCKFCKIFVLPKNVEFHIKTDQHKKSSSISSAKSVKTAQKKVSEKVNVSEATIMEMTKCLKDPDKKVVINLAKKLNGAINVFEFKYGKSGWLHFICKVCKSSYHSSSVPSHIQTEGHQKNLPKVSLKSLDLPGTKITKGEEVIEFLRNEDKEVGKMLVRKLKDKIIHFQPVYKREKLYFKCKVCRVKLLPKNVEAHSNTKAHLNYSLQNSSKSEAKSLAPSNEIVNLKSNTMRTSFAGTENKSTSDKILAGLNEHDRKIVLGFGEESERILISFTRYNNSKGQSNFICRVCKLTLFPKYVKSHFYNCTGVKNLMKNYQLVNLEDLNAKSQKTVKTLRSHNNKLYFFQLLFGLKSKKLDFFCTACNLILSSEHVLDHSYSSKHSKSLLSNSFGVTQDSLSKDNLAIVKKLQTKVKNRMIDFNFVYKIGTEELRLYCKLCQDILCPEKVEEHTKSKKHLNFSNPKGNLNGKTLKQMTEKISKADASQEAHTVPTSLKTTIISSKNNTSPPFHQNILLLDFDLLPDNKKKIVKQSIQNEDLKFLEFLETHGLNAPLPKCKICDLTLELTLAQNHFHSPGHKKNLELIALFENFLSLEERFRCILRNLFEIVGNRVKSYSLLHTNDVIKCKLCNLCIVLGTVNSVFLSEHLNRDDHLPDPFKDSSISCETDAIRVSDSIQHTKKTCEMTHVSSLSYGSFVGISAEQGMPNLQLKCSPLGASRENGSSSSSNLNHNPFDQQTVGTPQVFVCGDCRFTTDSLSIKDSNLKKDILDRIFIIKCCGKSVTKDLQIPQDYDIQNRVALSDDHKETLKTVIDEIGLKINDFEVKLVRPIGLQFRCLFCSLSRLLHPKILKTHINNERHIRFSESASFSNIGFKFHTDRNKKFLKIVYGQIGSNIGNYCTRIRFLCNLCNVSLDPNDVQTHELSNEHRNRSSGPNSHDDSPVDKFRNDEDVDSLRLMSEFEVIIDKTTFDNDNEDIIVDDLNEAANKPTNGSSLTDLN